MARATIFCWSSTSHCQLVRMCNMDEHNPNINITTRDSPAHGEVCLCCIFIIFFFQWIARKRTVEFEQTKKIALKLNSLKINKKLVSRIRGVSWAYSTSTVADDEGLRWSERESGWSWKWDRKKRKTEKNLEKPKSGKKQTLSYS